MLLTDNECEERKHSRFLKPVDRARQSHATPFPDPRGCFAIRERCFFKVHSCCVRVCVCLRGIIDSQIFECKEKETETEGDKRQLDVKT